MTTSARARKPRRKLTRAELARMDYAAGIPRDEIARDRGMRPIDVDRALGRGKRGRPPKEGYGPVRRVRLPSEVDALVVAEAERDGIPIAEVLASAVAASILPEGQWPGAKPTASA